MGTLHATPAECDICFQFRRSNVSKLTIAQFRTGAERCCLCCGLILGSIAKYDDFWATDEQNVAKDNNEESLSALKVSVRVYDGSGPEIIVIRPKRQLPDDKPDMNWLELQLYSHADEPKPFIQLQPAGDIPETSSSDKCFDTIQSWLDTCDTTHQRCPALPTKWRPSRLLEVVGNQLVKLNVDPLDISSYKYVAVSHSWGKPEDRRKPMPITTTSNLLARFESIPWTELTKSFEDAIDITVKLGLKYLWIDCLCIVQDDPNDWAFEAARMASVYQNAYVTIAATRAHTGDDGFYSSRTPSHKVLFTTNDGRQASCYVKKNIEHRYFTQPPPTFENLPLFGRAWVFQERVLSRRVVHYTDEELYWECTECVLCECQELERDRDWENKADERSNFKLEHARILSGTEDVGAKFKHWSNIVLEYSLRSLTFEMDRLPALSGIASQMAGPEMGRYMAGMWEASLPQALLWRADDGVLENTGQRKRSQQFIAPSWSWASCSGESRFWMRNDAETVEDKVAYLCKVVNIDCTRVNDDPYGRISAGHLRLEALALDAVLEHHVNRHDILRYRLRINADAVVDLEEDVQPAADDSDVKPGTKVKIALVLKMAVLKSETFTWQGLALVASNNGLGTYERIGRTSGDEGLLQDATKMEFHII